jgi:hypothetical protein
VESGGDGTNGDHTFVHHLERSVGLKYILGIGDIVFYVIITRIHHIEALMGNQIQKLKVSE